MRALPTAIFYHGRSGRELTPALGEEIEVFPTFTVYDGMDMSANTFYRRVREYELRHGITGQTSA